MAADPVVVDPKHYKVEFENDRVRVLRIKYGPHEKSPMHSHPANIVVMLSECDFAFYRPKGGKQDILGHVGQVLCVEEPYEHAPENLGDKVFEAICVELKK
jgi:quercetin dioxygenase-like cupin family protein